MGGLNDLTEIVFRRGRNLPQHTEILVMLYRISESQHIDEKYTVETHEVGAWRVSRKNLAYKFQPLDPRTRH